MELQNGKNYKSGPSDRLRVLFFWKNEPACIRLQTGRLISNDEVFLKKLKTSICKKYANDPILPAESNSHGEDRIGMSTSLSVICNFPVPSDVFYFHDLRIKFYSRPKEYFMNALLEKREQLKPAGRLGNNRQL
jgi:hypothetical protein